MSQHAPFYARLDEPARMRFEDKLKTFALTKTFIGAQGMVVDDTVRIVISATAARLIMNLPGEHYGRLSEIIVYADHYVHKGKDDVAVFGEAHHFGTVVLSYAAVLSGLRNGADGHNTGLHEFAHVLDVADGGFDGTPVLQQHAAYAPWALVMGQEYDELRTKKRQTRPVLRAYGATNEAEFFAVATEAFFEKPAQLLKRHPDLYVTLRDYYCIDPAGE